MVIPIETVKVIPQKQKLAMNFFETFPGYSLPSTVSVKKKNFHNFHNCHNFRLRDPISQSYPIYACTRANLAVIHRSTLHFAVPRNRVY